MFLGRADSSFPPEKFALWEVSRPPSLQLAIFPDQMSHIRSQFATCYPSCAHALDLSQPEQLIHLDVLRSSHRLVPSQHISMEAMGQISSFGGEPRSVILGDGGWISDWVPRSSVSGPVSSYCLLKGWLPKAHPRMDYIGISDLCVWLFNILGKSKGKNS